MTCRILVADDAQFVRVGLKDILSKHALVSEIYEAENGEEAIQTYKKFKPDLIFLDVNMPKVDGMEALIYRIAPLWLAGSGDRVALREFVCAQDADCFFQGRDLKHRREMRGL